MEKQQNKIKTVFFGSGSFALVILQALLKADFLEVTGVVTQPDKPAGRKLEIMASPVKQMLITQNYSGKIWQPEILADKSDEILQSLQPQLIIVADYGQFLTENIINYPQFKCLNVHGSLLPDLRGAVPIPMAILRGYSKTGVSIPVMTTGLDDGAIVASAVIIISSDDTTESLKAKMADLGADLLIRILPTWIAGKVKPVPQDKSGVTITERTDISKDKAEILPDTDCELAGRMVRAFNPWPVAWINIRLNNKIQRLKIFQAKPESREFPENGKIYKSGDGLYLSLQGGSLRLEDLQLAGKIRGTAKDYWFLAA